MENIYITQKAQKTQRDFLTTNETIFFRQRIERIRRIFLGHEDFLDHRLHGYVSSL